MRPSFSLLLLLSVVGLPWVTGCGSDDSGVVRVEGEVTVAGEPVDQGVITFLSADGKTPSAGAVIQGGHYSAELQPGAKKVLVLGSKVVGQTYVLEGVPDSGTRDKLETVTHPNYNAKHLTPLEVDITGPAEGLDFLLTKDGKGAG